MGQKVIGCRLAMNIAFVLHRGDTHNQGLVHMIQACAHCGSHALAIARIAARCCGPFHGAGEMFRHHVPVPIEPATGQNNALRGPERDALPVTFNLQPRDAAILT